MGSRQNMLRCLSAALALFSGAFGAMIFYGERLRGFPDSHLTELDRALEGPLTLVGCSALVLAVALVLLAVLGKRLLSRWMVVAGATLVIALVGAKFVSEWYLGVYLGLDSGQGG